MAPRIQKKFVYSLSFFAGLATAFLLSGFQLQTPCHGSTALKHQEVTNVEVRPLIPDFVLIEHDPNLPPEQYQVSLVDLYHFRRIRDSYKIRTFSGDDRRDYVTVVGPAFQKILPNANHMEYEAFQFDNADVYWVIHHENYTVYPMYPPGSFVNTIAGLKCIGSKALLTDTIRYAEKLFPGAFSFYPPTYTLPQEYPIVAVLREKEPDNVWILKPAGGYSSKGILVLYPEHEIPQTGSFSLQRYIDHPFLFRGFKFDMRIYILVASLDPLVIYHFPLGIPRIATKPYTTEREVEEPINLDDVLNSKAKFPTLNKCMHLTDPTMQKKQCGDTNSVMDSFPHTTEELRQMFAYDGIDFEPLMEKVWEMCAQAVIAGLHQIPENVRDLTSPKNRVMFFQLLGYDVMFEQLPSGEVEPRLIEINTNPNLFQDEQHPLPGRIINSIASLSGMMPRDPTAFSQEWVDLLRTFCDLKPDLSPDAVPGMLLSTCSPDTVKALHRVILDYQYRGEFNLVFPSTRLIRKFGHMIPASSKHDRTLFEWVLKKDPFNSI